MFESLDSGRDGASLVSEGLDDDWLDEGRVALLVEPPADPSVPTPDDGYDWDAWVERMVALDPLRPMSASERLEHAKTAPASSLAEMLGDIDPADLDDDGLIELALLWQRAENAAAAGKVSAVATFAGAEPESPDDPAAFAWAEVAAALGLGDREAARLVDTARRLTSHLPMTLEALRSGGLSLNKAHVIAQRTSMLTREQCADVEEKLLPKAAQRSATWCDNAVRRAVDQIDLDGLRDRHKAAKKDVHLGKDHVGGGMAELYARMTSVDVGTVYAAADAYARRMKAAGDERTLDQLRVAAIVDWAERFLTAPDAPRRHGRPITINIAVDLTTFLGLTDHAAEVLPTGALIPAQALRDLIPDAALRRIIVDPRSGHLLDVGRTTYRIPPGTAAFVGLRDVTATTPTGSAADAGAQDIDHMCSWNDGGPTDRDNLHSPTRRWHRAKTLAGWTVRRHGDGSQTRTSPLGRSYRVEPHDYRLGP